MPKSRRSSSRKMKHARKSHKMRKSHTRRNRRTRRRGGSDALSGASVKYHLSGSWPSRMSLGQGADYFKYHEGQHGGALNYGAFPGAVLSPGLPESLRGPAHVGGIDKAIADVAGLRDPPYTGGNRKSRRKNRDRSRRKNREMSKRKTRGGRRNKAIGNMNGNMNVKVANAEIVNAEVANVNAVNANMNAEVANVNAVNANATAEVANANAMNAVEVATNAVVGGRRRRRKGGALGYAPFPNQGMLLDSQRAYAQAGLNPEWKTDVAFTDAKIRDTQ